MFERTNISRACIIAALSVAGTLILLFSSVLLMQESSLAHADVAKETAYLTQFTLADQEHAPRQQPALQAHVEG